MTVKDQTASYANLCRMSLQNILVSDVHINYSLVAVAIVMLIVEHNSHNYVNKYVARSPWCSIINNSYNNFL